jgi:hypothetical protein
VNSRDDSRSSGGFAPEQIVLFLATATGTTEAAEEQDGYASGDEHREQGSKRE